METSNLSGRRKQAQLNDGVIRKAAREVFLLDPESPISAVAERAGVGISALYRRYENKDDLLRTLCRDALKQTNAEARAASEIEDAWEALTSFLMGVVEADVHSLTLRFDRTVEMHELARQTDEIVIGLFEKAQEEGSVRPDAVYGDIDLILWSCAALKSPDSERSAESKQRLLALELDGLSTKGDPLPGSSVEDEIG